MNTILRTDLKEKERFHQDKYILFKNFQPTTNLDAYQQFQVVKIQKSYFPF